MKLQIIFATGNANKVREVDEILCDPDIKVFTMKEVGLFTEPDENGTSFEENALIKAKAVAALYRGKTPDDLPMLDPEVPTVVMSDDSGLVIDALNGAPGIYSARYLGRETPYPEKMMKIMEMIRDVPEEKRSARFVDACACVVAPALLKEGLSIDESHPDETSFVVRGVFEGQIGYEILGEHGFGYDPFFYLPEYGMSSAQIPPEEKNRISHRGKAFRGMMEKLRDVMKQDPVNRI